MQIKWKYWHERQRDGKAQRSKIFFFLPFYHSSSEHSEMKIWISKVEVKLYLFSITWSMLNIFWCPFLLNENYYSFFSGWGFMDREKVLHYGLIWYDIKMYDYGSLCWTIHKFTPTHNFFLLTCWLYLGDIKVYVGHTDVYQGSMIKLALEIVSHALNRLWNLFIGQNVTRITFIFMCMWYFWFCCL